MLDERVLGHLLKARVQLPELLSVDALSLAFAVSLAEHLDFEGSLVRILYHHSLQLEGVTVQMHLLFKQMPNNYNSVILWQGVD